MKVRINGYEVEGTAEEIRRLLGAPQTVNPYIAPYVQPYPLPEPSPYWPLYITSTYGISGGDTYGSAGAQVVNLPVLPSSGGSAAAAAPVQSVTLN